MTEIVWTADAERLARSNTARFMEIHGIEEYSDLVDRSAADPAWFWDAVIDFLGIEFDPPYSQVLNTARGIEWATWFTDGAINLSEICVDRWALETPDAPAIVGEREDGSSTVMSFAELHDAVSRVAAGLRGLGVGPGDAVGVFLPMSPEAVISFLAIARLGAVFIPIFSGYGADAVATRLTDPKPRVLICADGFLRRGRVMPGKETADAAIAEAGDIEHVVVVRYAGRPDTPWRRGRDVWFESLYQSEPIPAAPTQAEDPVLLAYTSGTTGRPKGAIHVHGGLAVKLAQEGAFQGEFRPGDRVMWATDMGWIMGPWMVVAGLANGASIVTFDGAPNYPGPGRIWEIVEKHRITFLGISPTLIRSLQPSGADHALRHDLSSLLAFGSTGEPWNPDPWWWLFRDVGRERIPIINISGGTEIGACLLSVNLLQGLKPTSLGGPSLGVSADVFDETGQPVRNAVGELVVKGPWPGMTRGFWKEPDRYIATYWSRWPGVWVHGDWASVDSDGFWYLHGRSDETLNIAGKRLGPAEIESILVEHSSVSMAAAIGVPDEVKGESIVAYVVASEQSDELAKALADAVADSIGKPFRPKRIVFAEDLPRTRSAKIMRRVIRAVALGEEPGDVSSLENPAAVEGIEQL